MAMESMHIFLMLVMLIVSGSVKAETDPCDLSNYPVKWKSQLVHPNSYDLPAIFHKSDNSKVIVSATKAINYVKTNMAEHTPYLKDAKAYILNSLSSLSNDKLLEQSELWIALEGLQGQELNKAIHVMAGYQGLFEGLLLQNEASVSINGKLVSSSNAVYMVGKDPAPLDELNYVHKLIVTNSSQIIFNKCWLDSK
ncbi:hypothetical protein [uncultured Ferrimonas sp.]|uniref:hypothetical protein n=1 Tax=uncultured Ferrimonas sp. TaxID=432640 RepID=UPI002604AF00|nr:hypothetical protein [uncultured Ferrimonas sp.]